MTIPTLCYRAGELHLLDQTKLPREESTLVCRTVDDVIAAIRRLVVRGAPAIGCAAAYGICIAARYAVTSGNPEQSIREEAARLAASRPTAVNLFWAIERMTARLGRPDGDDLVALLEDEAATIEREDREMCKAIGRFGAARIPSGGILTHCNAGSLATAGDGTALSVLFERFRQRQDIHVYVDETRPLLQGARLTTWELQQRGVPSTLICDNTAGWAMQQGKIAAVVTGADRITAGGDVANKIGTYSVACLARRHGVPMFVAAPSSTFDLSLASGSEIPIEERAATEITEGFGPPIAPNGTQVWSPAFDVTPAELMTALITERGVIEPVTHNEIATTLSAAMPTVTSAP